MTSTEQKEIDLEGERIAPQNVEFPSGSPYLLKEVAEHDAPVNPLAVQAQLFLPEEGTGPRPAVLVAHGLGGQKPARELTYGAKFAKAGYVSLVLDSFEARDLADASDDFKALRVTTWTLLADIFAGLEFLAKHPRVDPDLISIMGFSWGGMTTVLTAYEQIRRAFLGDKPLRFAAHASYYGCSIPRLEDPTTTGAPVLMLLGKHDRNVSVERSRQICDDLRRGGSDVDLRIFDAYHQWDGDDEEKRHVFGSLADLHFRIGRDNEVVEEDGSTTMRGIVSRTLMIIRNLDWGGYDILRDEDLHRHSDELLLDFLGRVAAARGSATPDKGEVPLGAIGQEPASES